MLLACPLIIASCGDDDLDSDSIFDTSAIKRTDFDNWLLENYSKPYNIEFLYRYKDSETNNTYDVAPAETEKAKAMAVLIKHVWIDAYNQAMGDNGLFMKTYAPRVLQMLGSFQYKGDGSRTIGTAEGGVKVTLFGCNGLDLDHLNIDQDSPFPDRNADPMDMNYWFFHTMHHEFCHILTQTKNYDSSFQDISAADQRNGDWVNVEDSEAPETGFVSGYATSEYNEDFAEIYSTYVTHTPEAWNKLMEKGKVVQYDADNHVIYKQDKNGNYVPKLDEKGDTIFLFDSKGNPVYMTDINGDIVYAKDAKGNYIYKTDEEGYLIPMRDSKGRIIYQKDPFGDYVLVYDEETEKYYYVPEYEKVALQDFEKVPETDDTSYTKMQMKLDILRSYFKETWSLDIDVLRDIVLSRSREVVEKGIDIDKMIIKN